MKKIKLLVLPEGMKQLLESDVLTKEDLCDYDRLTRILSKEDISIYMILNSSNSRFRKICFDTTSPQLNDVMEEIFEGPFNQAQFDITVPLSDNKDHFHLDDSPLRELIINYLFNGDPKRYTLKYYDSTEDMIVVTPVRDNSYVMLTKCIEEILGVLNDTFKVPVEKTRLFSHW